MRVALLVVFCIGLLVVGLPAQAREWTSSDFRLRSWSVAEGLPGSHVSAVVQDADGFLWLATMAGLVRFDGVEFHVFNEAVDGLPSSRLTALDAGPSGRLWIGSEEGHLLLREHGGFRTVVEPYYLGAPVSSIAEAGDGSVWFSHGASQRGDEERAPLWQWSSGAPTQRQDIEATLRRDPGSTLTPQDKPGGPPTFGAILVRDGANSVWARAWGGSSVRVADAVADPFGAGDPAVQMLGSAELMARSVAGGVELLTLEGSQVIARLNRDADQPRGVWLRDRRGLLWVSTADALEVHAANGVGAVVRWSLDTQIFDLMEDDEGNIWIATRTLGLLQISTNAVRQLGPEHGVPLPSKLRLMPDGSGLMSMQLLQSANGQAGPRRSYRLQPNVTVPTPAGQDWELADRHNTRWVFGSEDLRGTRVDGSQARLARHCDALTPDPHESNTLWANSDYSLFRIRTFADRDPRVDGEWPMVVRSAPLFDADGSLWIGATNGLHRLRRGSHRIFGREDGLPVNEVRALYRDAAGGLWIGTYGGGLVHYDGTRFRTIDQRHGLLDNAVSSIVADRFGALWMSGNRGIQRVLLSDLDDFIDGRVGSVRSQLFGASHGLDNAEAVGPHSGIAVGDTLYFSTFGGLVVVDPSIDADREQVRPHVYLLDSAGRWPVRADTALPLAQGRRDFDLRFAAVHLSSPETLHYRHKLDGHDTDWIETDRRRTAAYRNLDPGSYRLRLQARHSGGDWMDATATPVIEVLPQWWETAAARVLAVLVAIGLLIGSWMLANQRIRKRALALEALVDERTAALQIERDQVAHQATRLHELAEGRARFMSGISHELRTPLSLILAPLTDITEGRHGELSTTLSGEIGRVRRNAERLLRLVERLLQVARIEAGGQDLHCQFGDFSAAIHELVEQLQPLAELHGSTLQAELPETAVPVWFDPLLMESVLVNLMVNGLRHTPAGTRVWVMLHVLDSEYVQASVRDDGPGIPADALPLLFERFFRVRGEHASGADGFGLGLPLVRDVVERHGGSVEVESSPAGTCFCVRLKRGREHLTDADIATGPPRPQQPSMLVPLELDGTVPTATDVEPTQDDRRLVLVVDDNAELRRLVRSYLQPQFHVREADCGHTGLTCVAEQLPDLIISDVMMPGMDGYEFCRILRSNPDTDFVPLLMLTAKAGLDHRIHGLEQGADAYLGKPFDRRELVATVLALLATRERLRLHLLRQPAEEVIPPVPASVAIASTTAPRYREWICTVIDARLANEQFDVDALATELAQDRSTLYRTIKAELGVSPSELLRERRLLRAHELLERRAGNISEIAYAVGFKTVAHFSTSFRQRFGLPPSQIAAVQPVLG